MKKYKQANHIYKPYLYTLFVNFFLFTLTGSIYGLITGGIGNLLLLPFYVGFAACATFSVYKACSVIYNNTTHRRSSKVIKNEAAFSPNKSLEPEDLIDLSDQPILNEEQESNPYTEEILTPEVVQDVRRDNKSNLVLSLNDKDYGSQQPPRASQAHGTGSFVSTSPTNQAASRSIRSISKPYLAGGLEDLFQPQNVTSPIKPTVPTPPPMLAAINNKPKVSFQSQNVNNSIIPTPPPLPPLPGDASQLPPPPPPMPESNLFTNKPEAQLQEIKIQSEPTLLSIPKLSDELLNSIRRFDNGSLKKFGDTKNTYQNSRDKLLDSIRNFNQKSLKKQKDLEQKDAHNKSTKQPTLVNELSNALDKIRQACAPSDSENDGDNHFISNSDEWKEDIKISPKAQEENSNEATKNYVKNSNYHMDSGISSGEGSLEKVSNNTEEMQKPNSLFRSSSLSNLNGIEEPQKTKQFLRPFFKFERRHPEHLSSC